MLELFGLRIVQFKFSGAGQFVDLVRPSRTDDGRRDRRMAPSPGDRNLTGTAAVALADLAQRVGKLKRARQERLLVKAVSAPPVAFRQRRNPLAGHLAGE